MTTDIHTHRLKPGVVPSKPRIWYRQSKSGKRLFIRLLDINKTTWRSLMRLLVENDVDVEEAIGKFGIAGAMEIPGYLLETLGQHYRMIELDEGQWLGSKRAVEKEVA